MNDLKIRILRSLKSGIISLLCGALEYVTGAAPWGLLSGMWLTLFIIEFWRGKINVPYR